MPSLPTAVSFLISTEIWIFNISQSKHDHLSSAQSTHLSVMAISTIKQIITTQSQLSTSTFSTVTLVLLQVMSKHEQASVALWTQIPHCRLSKWCYAGVHMVYMVFLFFFFILISFLFQLQNAFKTFCLVEMHAGSKQHGQVRSWNADQ